MSDSLGNESVKFASFILLRISLTYQYIILYKFTEVALNARNMSRSTEIVQCKVGKQHLLAQLLPLLFFSTESGKIYIYSASIDSIY